MTDTPQILEHANDQALYLWGTAAIFERRARSIKGKLSTLKVLGIVVPILLGGALATFGTTWRFLEPLIYVTGAVGLLQLVGSAVALAMNWDDGYANAKEAQGHNTRLSEQYKKVADRLKSNPSDTERSTLEQRMELLDVERGVREQMDLKSNISAFEKRVGLREGLHQFQRKCVTCNVVPNPRKPSTCDTCGK